VGAAPRWPHDHEPCDDGTKDEREHSGRVNDRHEPAAAVFELDVSGRCDSSAASSALALLALRRVRAAAGADPESRDRNRDDGHAIALNWRSEHSGGTHASADSLGEHGQQLVGAPARYVGRRRFGHA
jgi:hypothetical protein